MQIFCREWPWTVIGVNLPIQIMFIKTEHPASFDQWPYHWILNIYIINIIILAANIDMINEDHVEFNKKNIISQWHELK